MTCLDQLVLECAPSYLFFMVHVEQLGLENLCEKANVKVGKDSGERVDL